ncbi:type II toxin-antitoxin system HicB family antitoxin [Planktothrix agardhii]|uniref:type II toxin-antitoxin system HicB family antitoxin n=1 Tax=Planktothrix agardhii TaxID=1160 RepID=UPI002B211324|nr:type II toxin-antitoxin system HicB family antitoxin [Planktothrix agardhii]MEA5560676.1 type II toxin-antitoxin system HicB family antitoxin [Planktothrix agardhii UHCC 0887]
MIRRVTIYSGEDGYWVVECPSLPGCVSQGKTQEEALINIKEAIQGYILALEEDGLPVPLENVAIAFRNRVSQDILIRAN